MFKPSTASDPRQRLFDNAWNGLKSQGFAKCTNSGTDLCRYRGPTGCKCAIGWNIPDDRYSPRMDSNGGDPAASKGIMTACGLDGDDADLRTFVIILQECHDLSLSSRDMQQRLSNFAGSYRLSIPVGV